jgi:protein ImuA
MQGVMAAKIEALRAHIAALEKRPALAQNAAGINPAAAHGLLVAPAGSQHEIFSDERRNTGAAMGFALGMAAGLLTHRRPAVLVMQLIRESHDMGLPYGAGLASFGIDPDAVILTRTETVAEFLWAIEEALSCASVAAVLADIAGDHKELDFTTSRRLTLRAQDAGTSVFLSRYGRGREASAARFRWHVMPVPSGSPPFDARAPGQPRFAVTLEKGRLAGFSADQSLLMDWTANGFALVESNRDRDRRTQRAAPLSGALPATLGDRLSQAS